MAERFWIPVVSGACAGGLGWGIRGQYGHETGAMIAGLLVGLALTLWFCPQADRLAVARAVAWCTVAMGFGGSMTYGQTVGLTHDPELVGNQSALAWGMLGLAIKGGIWIGFAGLYLGMGLGGTRYRPGELALLMVGAVVLFFVGRWVLNSPFDPAHRILPRFYFSADWRWLPEADLKPRREVWGGLLFALLGSIAYATIVRRDGLAGRLALWGALGGALGFPLGQSLQAVHAWNRPLFRLGLWAQLDPVINWWNFMETTFGATMGAALGLGLWLNRKRIAPPGQATDRAFRPATEWILALVHVALLLLAEFTFLPVLGLYTELSLVMGMIPIVGIAGGRWWPYLLALPITLLPIAGKTVRQLVYQDHALPAAAGWVLYFAVPLALAGAVTVGFVHRGKSSSRAWTFTAPALLLTTWTYFLLNFAFFRFPWPWNVWTVRTPNALVFLACAVALSVLAASRRWRVPQTEPGAGETR